MRLKTEFTFPVTLCLALILINSNTTAQSANNPKKGGISYKDRFCQHLMRNLAFIKRKSDRILLYYSVEGGSIYEYAVEYLPENNRLTLYVIETPVIGKVRSFRSSKQIEKDSLKNEFSNIWKNGNVDAIEDITHYCKSTMRSSAMIIVEVSKNKRINYFTATHTDVANCNRQEILVHRKLLDLAFEISFNQ